jgi:hypothetical protein
MPCKPEPILLGSTFPLSLIRRTVIIRPQSLETLRTQLAGRPVVSFWGHPNTVADARQHLGIDVTPPNGQRPALSLTTDQLPLLEGQVFTECWVLSPEYAKGFRPGIGQEVGKEKLTGWQVLQIVWLSENQQG